MPLSEEATRRIAFIRYVYGIGQRHAREPEPLASAALLMFHDSVELFLALAAESLNVFKKGMQFLEYFTAIDKVIGPDALAERGAMVRLNEARVGLKHYSNVVARSAVLEFADRSRAFFDLNAQKLFAVAFDEVSLSSLISVPEVRAELSEADSTIASSDWEAALRHLAIAFVRLCAAHGIARHVPHSMPLYLGNDSDARAVATHLNQHDRAIADIKQDLNLIRRGINMVRLQAFYRCVPHAAIMADGSARTVGGRAGRPPSRETARFCYDFIVETALELQAEDAAIEEVLPRRSP